MDYKVINMQLACFPLQEQPEAVINGRYSQAWYRCTMVQSNPWNCVIYNDPVLNNYQLGGGGGVFKSLLERTFQRGGVGGFKVKNLSWWGMDIFWNHFEIIEHIP